MKTVVLARIGSDIRFHPRFLEFSAIYLFEPVLCNPARGNEKGKVESGIKYIRSSFLAGRQLENAWLQIQQEAWAWRDGVANVRIHGTTRERPLDRFLHEKPLLQPLPSKPFDPSIIRTVKATSQALVHFDGNAYSVPHTLAYQTLLLKATFQEVRVFVDTRLVATHRRSFERGVVMEDPKHYEGLVATKKKAWASKLQQQFLALGDTAAAYLEGLVHTELHLSHHLAKILELLQLYTKTEVLQAVSHALEFKAFGAAYVKNILLQQQAAASSKQPIPLVIPSKPDWTKLFVEDHPLWLYDELFDEEAPHDTPKS